MKTLRSAALAAAIILSAGQARAACTCSPVFDAWADGAFQTWVDTAYAAHIRLLVNGINSIAATQSSADNANAAAKQLTSKAESQAGMQSRFMAANVNRVAEAQMKKADQLVQGETLAQKRKTDLCEDANSEAGAQMTSGMGNDRQMQKNDRELYKWKAGQGTDVLAVRKSLNEGEKKIRGKDDQAPSLVPQNGLLTYPTEEYAAQVRRMAEMMVDPEAPLGAEGLNLGEEGKAAYNAAYAPREMQQSLRKDAVLELVNWYTGTYKADGVIKGMMSDGQATSGSAAIYAANDKQKVSKAAFLSAYAEYFLSPGVSNDMGAKNASSNLYEVMSLMLVVQEERTRAAKLIAAMLAMGNAAGDKKMLHGIDALSRAR